MINIIISEHLTESFNSFLFIFKAFNVFLFKLRKNVAKSLYFLFFYLNFGVLRYFL